MREQEALFGAVASDSTAFRVVDRIAVERRAGWRRCGRRTRGRASGSGTLRGAPERLTIDVDATLITAHSEKEEAAGNYKGGYGFFPLHGLPGRDPRGAGAGCCGPGTPARTRPSTTWSCSSWRSSRSPAAHIETIEILVRADSAGATHALLDYCREEELRFSVGYELTEPVRSAILQTPEDAWVPALDQDGSERDNGEVAEITSLVDLAALAARARG